MKSRVKLKNSATLILCASLGLSAMNVHASEDVKVLLEILLEKGVITQEEFDKKLKKVAEAQEIKEFNQAQDIRKVSKELEQRAQTKETFKSKFTTEFYGQVSSGYYSENGVGAAGTSHVNGLSDQPKAENRLGLLITRELDSDFTAGVRVESGFSVRTGGLGKDSAGTGTGVNPIFDREANIRGDSKTYGSLILGRGANLQEALNRDFDARSNWNFGGLKTVGRYVGFHSASGINRADKMIRYISPEYKGLKFDGGISFGGVTNDTAKNTSYFWGGRYKKDDLEIGCNHIEARLSATSNLVNNRVDFLAAKYTLSNWTFNAGYVISRNPTKNISEEYLATASGKSDADTFFTGAVYRFTPELSANFGWYQVTDKFTSDGKNSLNMTATGLMWTPYKDWDFFVDYAHAMRKANATGGFAIYDKFAPDTSASGTLSDSKKNQSGVSIGTQFKF